MIDATRLAMRMVSDIALTGSNAELLLNTQLRETQIVKLRVFIKQGRPIQMVLPGFPAKSPNRQKTISPLPDLAEFLGMNRLNDLCRRISTYYPPGATVRLCCDGHVFSDLVMVSDAEAEEYLDFLNDMVEQYQFKHLETFSMSQVFSGLDSATQRTQLIDTYGENLAAVRHNVLTCARTQAKFNGIHRFILEDRLVIKTGQSKNRIRHESKAIAYQVVQRSNSWGRLVDQRFGDAIRLSIHPQPSGSQRVYFQLVDCHTTWRTPWHSAALVTLRGAFLLARREAEQLEARLCQTRSGLLYYTLV